jgi:hypothetical protein
MLANMARGRRSIMKVSPIASGNRVDHELVETL